jgi:hypothetical protein
MKVIAAPGLTCPMEGKPRDYIGDDRAVEVPATAYYARLVTDGSLIETPSGTNGSKGKEVKPDGK